jgi:hypothetical protein
MIVRATLKIRKSGLTGADPFTTHQKVAVDIRYGPFSRSNPLQVTDFQAAASRNAVGVILNAPVNNWYSSNLRAVAFPYINLIGITQLRLRFQLDDNDNLAADTIQFYSGDYGDLAFRPRLEIQYYVP